MSIQVSPEMAAQLRSEQLNFAFNGDIGGIPRKKYYTPDGRVIFAIIDRRQRIKKDSAGKVIWTGEVDANLDNGEYGLPSDRGWFARAPSESERKVGCPSCARWHDDIAQVEECKKTQDAKIATFEGRVKKERLNEIQDRDLQISALSKQVADLTKMVAKLTQTMNKEIT